ncbi:hypothetical protein E8E13_007344 [Curvularia kusanoi]|uniref:Thiamine pyrophosphate enzyme N-terminal TPP-binding domain-containing protein n=1 Tax=Curvularia kusanoi TaxID=90978 RepID=A0A9P4TKM4_CURKU|nr:hypothetical protein E8E13_007344 [Curvularia kusanoi]
MLHIVINVLSTLLLSASNYTMQVLTAPTYDECIRAHRQGKWLDIGILSMRNIKSLTLRRRVLWFALCISSLPLHLLYNASVFQVVTANDYNLNFVDRRSDAWGALDAEASNKTSNLSNLTISDIKTTYDQDYVSAHGDVVLFVEKISVEYESVQGFNNREDGNNSLGAFNISLDAASEWEPRSWAKAIDSRGWARAESLNGHWRMPTNSATLWLHITGAFARPVVNSEVQMSLTFLMVVIVCNAIKVGCLVFLLWKGTDDAKPPLVTIGDAISSFLEAPDSSTRGYCTYSKAEFLWKTGQIKRTLAREQDGRAAKWDRRCDGIWEERTYNYGSAISKRKRVLLTFLGFGIPTSGLLFFAVGWIPVTPWAAASPLRFSVGSQRFDGNTTAQLAFIANSPQLLLSIIFLYFNNLFTSMALAYEWSKFGSRRKGLRVTRPRGEQRETYFLQLPLKIGVPLNALSGILHWLASQMLFVVRVDRRNRDAALPIERSVTTSSIPSYQNYPAYPLAATAGQSPPRSSYTTAFAAFEALWEVGFAGVTACFVNVGSDHPSIIEAIIKGKRERPEKWPRFITCPSEITAISMADGYARVSGRPQAVVVHVDVGTQALGQGLHNASVARVPVFILAGLCPYTEAGEMTGSRTEYMHWLQEAPDQKAIVRQYCRYTGEIRTGLNVKQTIARALQFANSGPKGPVYVASARETLAEQIETPYILDQEQWTPIGPGALPADAVEEASSITL